MGSRQGGWLRRFGRLWPHGNPLVRGVDRLELLTGAVAVLVGLLLLPVMLVLGSLTHAGVVAKSEEQARTWHRTVATLTEDAPEPGRDSDDNVAVRTSDVPATWVLPDGSIAAGPVPAKDGLDAGAKVGIWLDRDGRMADPPAGPGEAVFAAVVVALVGWLAVIGLLALAQFGVHCRLNRRRYRAWDQEWARLEPGWNNLQH